MPEEQVGSLADKLTKIDESLNDALNSWVSTGELSDVEVEGYSMTSLINDHGLKGSGALIMLNWLLREPEEAKKVIHRRDKIVQES